MTKAKHVQLMLGTGTLANDAIALQLRSLKRERTSINKWRIWK